MPRYRVLRSSSMSTKIRQSLAVLVLLLCAAVAAAQRDYPFQLAAAGEAIAEITATAPGASWDKPGAEGTVATIYLDGKYNQDLLIVRGAEESRFRVFL